MSQQPWPGPAWQNLSIDANCTAYGLYASWILDRATEPPIPAVLSFWHAVQNASSPSSDILEWHEWARDHREVVAKSVGAQLETYPACRDPLCAAVDSEVPQTWVQCPAHPKLDPSEADHGHIKWLVMFAVPAALITLHYTMALARFFMKLRKPALEDSPSTPSQGIFWWTSQAFSSTSSHIFSAAAVITLAIQSASLLALAFPSSQGTSPWSAFIIAGSFFLLASTLPLVIPTTQEKWFKGAVSASLFVLSTAGWAVSVSQSEEMFSDEADEFSRICPYLLPHTGALQAAVFTTAGMVWMPPLFGICVLVLLCFFRCNSRRMWQATWVNTVARLAAALYGVVNLISLWGIIGTLAAYVNRVPESQRKSVWGVEQTLLIAVWAPPIAVLLQRFFCEFTLAAASSRAHTCSTDPPAWVSGGRRDAEGEDEGARE